MKKRILSLITSLSCVLGLSSKAHDKQNNLELQLKLNKENFDSNQIDGKIESAVFTYIRQYCIEIFKDESKEIRRGAKTNPEFESGSESVHYVLPLPYNNGIIETVFTICLKKGKNEYEKAKERKKRIKRECSNCIDWILEYLTLCVQLKRNGITKLIKIPDLSGEMLSLEKVLDKWKSEKIFDSKKNEIIDEFFKIHELSLQ